MHCKSRYWSPKGSWCNLYTPFANLVKKCAATSSTLCCQLFCVLPGLIISNSLSKLVHLLLEFLTLVSSFGKMSHFCHCPLVPKILILVVNSAQELACQLELQRLLLSMRWSLKTFPIDRNFRIRHLLRLKRTFPKLMFWFGKLLSRAQGGSAAM